MQDNRESAENGDWLKVEVSRRREHLQHILSFENEKLERPDGEVDIHSLLSAAEDVARCSPLDPLVNDAFVSTANALAKQIDKAVEDSKQDLDGERIFDLKYIVKRLEDGVDKFRLNKNEISKILTPSLTTADKLLRMKKTQQLMKAISLLKGSFHTIPIVGMSAGLSVVHGSLEASKVAAMSSIVNLATNGKGKQGNLRSEAIHLSRRLFALELGCILLTFVKEKVNELGIQDFTRRLKVSVFKSAINQDLEFIERNDMDEICSLILRVDSFASTLYSLPVSIIDMVSRIGSSMFFLFDESHQFATFLGLILPLRLGLTYMISRLRDYLEALVIQVDMGGAFRDVVGNLRSAAAFTNMKLFTREDLEVRLFEQKLKAYESFTARGKLLASIFSPLSELLDKSVQVASLLAGTYLAKGISTNLSEFISLAEMTFDRMRFLHSMVESVNESVLNPIEKLHDLLERKSNILAKEKTYYETADSVGSWNIEFKNVSFNYPTRKEATILDDISFQIVQGEHVGIMGESGCGKSTLFSILLKFYEIRQGKVFVGGNDLSSISSKYLRESIAIVSQNVYLPRNSVRENLLYVLDSISETGDKEEKMKDALRKAHCYDLFFDKTRFPQQWFTDLGRNCDKLSGGEKQRLNFARVLLRQPKILLLDEYTSALDEDLQYKVQKSLLEFHKESNGQMTIISIAHRLSNFRDCDKLIVMNNHKIEEIGTPRELLESSKKGSVFRNFVARHEHVFSI